MNWYGGGGYKGGHVSSMKPPERLPSARCMPPKDGRGLGAFELDGVLYTQKALRELLRERHELAIENADLRAANGLFQMEAIDYRRRLNRADEHLRLRTSALTRVVAGKRRATKVAQEWALRATNAEVKVAAVEVLADDMDERGRPGEGDSPTDATARRQIREDANRLRAALASAGRTEPEGRPHPNCYDDLCAGKPACLGCVERGRTEPAPEKPEPKLPDPSRRGW